MITLNSKWIYLLKCIEDDGTISYKIGYTNDINKRLKGLQTGNKYDISLVSKFWSDFGPRLESTLHIFLYEYRYKREWFDLPEEVVENFINICQKHESNFKLLYEKNMYIEDINNRMI